MLKRPVVSLFHSLKSKNYRYCWIQPKNINIDKNSLDTHKYNVKVENKEIMDFLKLQEIQLKEINDQLTNQKKVFENIYSNLKEMSTDTHNIVGITFLNILLIKL